MSAPSRQTSDASEPVRRFFKAFERDTNAFDVERIGGHYCEVFLFGSPQGVRAVRREDLVRALPARRGFFEKLGLKGTTYTALDETVIDGQYVLVEAHFTMRFEREDSGPVENRDSSTFMLHRVEDGYEIACQIEHDEVTHRMQALALLPVEG